MTFLFVLACCTTVIACVVAQHFRTQRNRERRRSDANAARLKECRKAVWRIVLQILQLHLGDRFGIEPQISENAFHANAFLKQKTDVARSGIQALFHISFDLTAIFPCEIEIYEPMKLSHVAPEKISIPDLPALFAFIEERLLNS